MPTFDTVTKSSQSLWKSPDGQREIFGVVLDYNGQQLNAKTYSKDIAREGWSGQVESYEKEGRNGKEVFVKQAAKASFGGGYGKGGGAAKADPFTMYLSYAKDLAVAAIKDGKFDEELYGQLLDAVKLGGSVLYESRPDAPKDHKDTQGESVTPAQKETRGDDYIDWSTIDSVFPE